MPYIGRAATNAGSVRYLDDISSGFDGSDVTFTAQVGGVSITPGQENINLYLDGVFQHPGSGNAYTLSGSTITFDSAPVANTVFTAYVVGEGAYLDDATVITAKIGDDAITASKLDDDGTGFQVGDLGVGGSLTSGDKLTVTGRLRASGGIIGDLTGNVTGNTSGTAATLATARAINGVNFDGSAAITVTAAAGTLTGSTLASGVTASSLTSVGDLTGLTVNGNITMDKDGQAILKVESNDDAAELRLRSFYNGSARQWSLFSDNAQDAFIINDGTTRFTLTDTSATFAGQVKIDTDQRYFTKWESSYGTARDYWWRNDGGLLQLGEGAEGDGQVKYTFDTANKRLGIGTTSPSVPLDVVGTLKVGAASGGRYFNLINDSANSYLDVSHGLFFRTNGVSSLKYPMFLSNDGNVNFGDNTSDSNIGIQSHTTGDVLIRMGDVDTMNRGIIKYHNATSDAAEYMSFFTANTERLKIEGDGTAQFSGTATFQSNATFSQYIKHDGDSSTYIAFNDTEPKVRFNVDYSAGWGYVFVNDYSTNTNIYLCHQNTHGMAIDAYGASASSYLLNLSSGSERFKVWGDGQVDVNGTEVHSASDINLKKNISTLSGSLAKINAMRGVKFKWKSSEDNRHEEHIDVVTKETVPRSSRYGKYHIGLIAQELEEILPEVVNTREDGIKSISDGNQLSAVIIEAIKEITVRLEALENA